MKYTNPLSTWLRSHLFAWFKRAGCQNKSIEREKSLLLRDGDYHIQGPGDAMCHLKDKTE